MNKSQIRADLAHLPGSDSQKADIYLCANRPGHSTLPWHQRAYESVQLLKSLSSNTGGEEDGRPTAGMNDSPRTTNMSDSDKEDSLRARIGEKAKELIIAVNASEIDLIVERVDELQEILDEVKLHLGSSEKAHEAIKSCAGRNQIEKAIFYLTAHRHDYQFLPWAKKVGVASQFLRTGNYEVHS